MQNHEVGGADDISRNCFCVSADGIEMTITVHIVINTGRKVVASLLVVDDVREVASTRSEGDFRSLRVKQIGNAVAIHVSRKGDSPINPTVYGNLRLKSSLTVAEQN